MLLVYQFASGEGNRSSSDYSLEDPEVVSPKD